MSIDRSDDPERGEVAHGGMDAAHDVRRGGDGPSEAYALGGAGDRAEYFESLRESAWGEAVERFRTRWDEHRERWPEAGREAVDRSGDPDGSWRGDSGRYLDAAANKEVDARHERIADVERNVVSPAMKEIESCDSDRTLVGWEYRLKGADRLKDKVVEEMTFKSRTADGAVANVKDCIRYTFQYSDDGYAGGVRADVDRLQSHGFEEVELRNSWTNDLYKGINSRWREPDSGQLFEVQFHTQMSFEAKQLTHVTYERIRSPGPTDTERDELSRLQSTMCRTVPVPDGAADIEDYPRRGNG